ncbi:hypothetical protein PMIN01_10496 [Paraphaeosphaeria minitans]|uniref:Uncharacterized protein n=1 Tax=Paraphaeosphaeria minitans TaxID=565426 RepID=A0A9P6GC28_9PLEO|nr:hypothetical protein PMIN01_10496 [Paraphaeosphaeria minitans]
MHNAYATYDPGAVHTELYMRERTPPATTEQLRTKSRPLEPFQSPAYFILAYLIPSIPSSTPRPRPRTPDIKPGDDRAFATSLRHQPAPPASDPAFRIRLASYDSIVQVPKRPSSQTSQTSPPHHHTLTPPTTDLARIAHPPVRLPAPYRSRFFARTAPHRTAPQQIRRPQMQRADSPHRALPHTKRRLAFSPSPSACNSIVEVWDALRRFGFVGASPYAAEDDLVCS